jgi:hypothetical protein
LAPSPKKAQQKKSPKKKKKKAEVVVVHRPALAGARAEEPVVQTALVGH